MLVKSEVRLETRGSRVLFHLDHVWISLFLILILLLVLRGVIIILFITTKRILGLCLDLPLWRETESLQLLLQILQLSVELVLFAIKVSHYVLDMSVAVSTCCVLLRLLLSSWLSDALLVTVRRRVERFISSMIGTYRHLVVSDLVLMLSPCHLGGNEIVVVDGPLIT